MNIEKEAEHGRQAELLIDNPIYKDSIQAVREGIFTAWAACPIRDKEGQHELKLMLKLLNDLTSNIQMVAQTGKLARLEIERKRSLAQRVKDFAA